MPRMILWERLKRRLDTSSKSLRENHKGYTKNALGAEALSAFYIHTMIAYIYFNKIILLVFTNAWFE
jgi:hypothetical protein